jgi:hypothetical protein
MSAYMSTFLRQLTCAAAAVVISAIVSMSFVQSTATARAVVSSAAVHVPSA